jgi:hypothetical protein
MSHRKKKKVTPCMFSQLENTFEFYIYNKQYTNNDYLSACEKEREREKERDTEKKITNLYKQKYLTIPCNKCLAALEMLKLTKQ